MTCLTCIKRWVNNGIWYCRRLEVKPYPVIGNYQELKVAKACKWHIK